MRHTRKLFFVSNALVLAAFSICVLGVVALAEGAQNPPGPGQTATNPLRYQVNYRASSNDPWQLYASTRSLANANAIAAEVKATGYEAEVVSNQTPAAQLYPDAEETSASRYYPTSNWAQDYNYYVVPGGNNNYGTYAGWNPWYGYRSYPNYWWNGGRSYYGAGWGGHYWGGGWRRGGGWGGAGWSGGAWSGHHRNWNMSHADRSTHAAHSERNGEQTHQQYHAHQASAGHHQPGHHAAARHASQASSEHRGAGHRGNGAAVRPAIAPAGTVQRGTPLADTAQRERAGTTTRRGAMPAPITRAITIHEKTPASSINSNSVPCNRHDNGQRQASNRYLAYRSGRNASALLREMLHGARRPVEAS